MDWTTIIYKALLGGPAAVGFAVLFNVPRKTLFAILIMGIVGVGLKFSLLAMNVHIVIASFTGAAAVGLISQFASSRIQTPPYILAIPSVIPMVPGIYTYKMMLGIVRLTGNYPEEKAQEIFMDTLHNGLNATFVIMALSLGVSAVTLLLRRESLSVFSGKK